MIHTECAIPRLMCENKAVLRTLLFLEEVVTLHSHFVVFIWIYCILIRRVILKYQINSVLNFEYLYAV